MRIKALGVFAILFALGPAAFPSLAHAQPPKLAGPVIKPAGSCSNLMAFKMVGINLQITKAAPVAATTETTNVSSANAPMPDRFPAGPLPSRCLAEGIIDAHTGADGKSYGIRFALALPDAWSGRFLFQGGGGLDGVVRPPVGVQATGYTPALARGFAIVSTDSGHEGALFDGSFNKDQTASLDFAYIAMEKVTAVAKEIIAKYYGQPIAHSYFVGCSTGGRQAMLVTQRLPNEFDGVVSGDPAMRTGISGIGGAWASAAFAAAAPKGSNGKPDIHALFSESDKKLITNAILDACDANDGLKDGMIFNTQACRFDPSILICKGEKTDSCLTSAQAGAIAKAFAGPKDSQGKQVYAPFPYDAGVALSPTPTMFGEFLARSGGGGANPALTVDVEARELAAAANPTEALTDTTWANLSGFSSHGGKLIFFHGMSDPAFSPLDTLDYYEHMAAENGGSDSVQNWSRIFLIPGMNHCMNGPGLDRFDFLGAVVDWVEKGTSPESVVATGKAFPGRSRPLCAYPKYAHYKGQGDPQDASNFACLQ